jgi:hypothetical protein
VVGIGSLSAGYYFVHCVSKVKYVASRAFGTESASTGGHVLIELADCATESNPSENDFCKRPRYDRNVMSRGT